MFTPCEWPVGECGDCLGSPGSPGEQHPAVDMAIQILWGATGYQYGTCETTVTICRDHVCTPTGCCGKSELVLPGPVVAVSEVVIFGEVLSEDSYQVENYRYLVRLDGQWPREVTVTYEYGFPPPAGAALVTAELACELSKAMCNDDTCRLPKRIVSKTRQGVTVRFPEFEDGKTGLPNVDMWISSVRSRMQPPSVISPDSPRVRYVT